MQMYRMGHCTACNTQLPERLLDKVHGIPPGSDVGVDIGGVICPLCYEELMKHLVGPDFEIMGVHATMMYRETQEFIRVSGQQRKPLQFA